MRDRGEFFLPRYADGTPRLNKPLLFYWVGLAGTAVGGETLPGFRFPSLLGACLLLGVTGAMARRLFPGSRWSAPYAIVVLGSCLLLHELATRSTPDLLLCLFLTWSASGFVRILLLGDGARGASWAAWLGAGLAVATKGGLGLVFVLFALVAWLVQGGRRPAARRFAPGLPILAGIGAGAAGYLPYVLEFGWAGLRDAVDDQIGRRVLDTPTGLGSNVVFYIGGLARYFAPSLLILLLFLPVRGRAFVAAAGRDGTGVRFLGAWAAGLLLVFSFANTASTRYLAPAFPLVAIVMARLLAALVEPGGPPRGLRTLNVAGVAVAGTAAATLAVLALRVDARLAAAGLAVAAVSVGGCVFILRNRDRSGLLVGGALVLLVGSLSMSLIRPGLSASPARELARRLSEETSPETSIQSRDPAHAIEGQIRVLTRFGVNPLGRRERVELPDPLTADVLIRPDKPTDGLLATSFTWTRCGFEYERWSLLEIWKLLRADDPAAHYERKRRYWYVGTKRR